MQQTINTGLIAIITKQHVPFEEALIKACIKAKILPCNKMVKQARDIYDWYYNNLKEAQHEMSQMS